MTPQANIDQHKRILGTLYVVFGLLNLVVVLMIVFVASSIIPIYVHEEEVLMIIGIVKVAVITFTSVLSAPALIAGFGLLYKKEWAVTLAFIIGIIGLLGFPIWTFIGIYSIVVFVMTQNSQKTRQASDLI
ncbi:MAG: hypothetical protein U5K79_09345 [Cyclobacteriaceae bacterium]|nr:hypothetical protein [Cyclobacteriaceae bacterium]